MLSIGPELERTVLASFKVILVKSTPSTSKILSIFFNKRLAAPALFTSSTKIPCKKNVYNHAPLRITGMKDCKNYLILQFCYCKPDFRFFWHTQLHLKLKM